MVGYRLNGGDLRRTLDTNMTPAAALTILWVWWQHPQYCVGCKYCFCIAYHFLMSLLVIERTCTERITCTAEITGKRKCFPNPRPVGEWRRTFKEIVLHRTAAQQALQQHQRLFFLFLLVPLQHQRRGVRPDQPRRGPVQVLPSPHVRTDMVLLNMPPEWATNTAVHQSKAPTNCISSWRHFILHFIFTIIISSFSHRDTQRHDWDLCFI